MAEATLNKCEDCGFLAMRHKASRELREAEHDFKGQLRMVYDNYHPDYPHMDSEIYERTPICLRGLRNFRRPEISTGMGSMVDWSPIKELWDSSACFTEHMQGLTPKEHWELLNRQRMLEREDQRDKEMRGREDDRDKKVEALQERLHRREMWIMGGAVTIAVIVGSILAATIEAGWVGRPW